MEKYRKVENKNKVDDKPKENEIRITAQGKLSRYVGYAVRLLENQEKPVKELVLKAMGRAINKTVTLAELIKRKVFGLHQITRIESTEIHDVWEPLEEGLDKVQTSRPVASITIILSLSPLESSDPGYQAPLSKEQFDEQSKIAKASRGRGGPRRRGGRGGKGTDAQPEKTDDKETPSPRGRRGGRGRGRGGRGRGRGGNKPASNNNAEGAVPSPRRRSEGATAEPNSAPRGGRGRGRGGRGRGGRGGRGRGNSAPQQTPAPQ